MVLNEKDDCACRKLLIMMPNDSSPQWTRATTQEVCCTLVASKISGCLMIIRGACGHVQKF